MDPHLNIKTRFEEIEQDQYIDGVKDDDGNVVIRALTDKEKDWLNRFNEEFVNANFSHPGKKVKADKASRKKAYDKNNARNRCIYTKAKASGQLQYIEDLKIEKKEQLETAKDSKNEEIDENKWIDDYNKETTED